MRYDIRPASNARFAKYGNFVSRMSSIIQIISLDYIGQGGYLSTHISMDENDLFNSTASSYPYYGELVSMIPYASNLCLKIGTLIKHYKRSLQNLQRYWDGSC